MAACKYKVIGRVQGVGFRFWTAQTARALNLTGWVCNRPDGSVELEAHGEETDLATIQKQLWQGPPFSEVTDVICIPCIQPDKFSDFTIRRDA